MLTRPPARIRRHLPFLIITTALIIAMTWPAMALVFDADAFAVPTRNADVWQKLWDVWHWQRFLAGESSFYHSDALFYPVGVSLAYENFSLPQMIAVGLLSAILPIASAYTLTYLLIVFAVACSAYVYLNYLFRDRWLAILGACVFGFSQHVIAHAAHPDVNLILSFPLTAYCLQRGIREGRLRHLLAGGFIAGFTAFLSLYIFACLLISLALMILAYAIGRWKDLRFWRWMLLLALAIAFASAGRVLPILSDSHDLSAALAKGATKETGTDLLSYFVNYRHPITTPVLKSLFAVDSPFYEPHTSYLGYLPLALIIIGLLRSGSRRLMLPWLALALPFLLLRLGSALQIDGEQFSHIVLPKAFLADLLPPLIAPFHATDHFQMGLLLPLAVMTGYGLKSIIGARPANQRRLITLALAALIAFEYYETTASRVLPAEQLAFIDWLREDGAEATPRLINLPLGRQHSKLYGFHQTLTGFPQVEGLTGRTPPAAYAYIEGNLLLNAWRGGDGILCFPPRQSIYLSALEALRKDGFTHVIWHHAIARQPALARSFVDAQAAYSDEYARVYRLEDLRQSCDLSASLSPSLLEPLRRIESSPVIVPQAGSAILSILSDESSAAPGVRIHEAALIGMRRHATVTLADGEVVPPPGLEGDAPAVDDLLASKRVILLAYNPQTADAQATASYRAWLADGFNSCRRLTETDEAIVEYFLDDAFACELAFAAAPLEVHYEKGIQLGNLLAEASESALDIQLLWKRLPAEAHALSIQFTDGDGDRAAGEDFVIRGDAFVRRRIDASRLPPGEYEVKMILYDYASGASVSGAVASSQTRFERALAIASWTANSP